MWVDRHDSACCVVRVCSGHVQCWAGECCINEDVSQSYVGKSVVSLLSIPTLGGGEGPTIRTMGGEEDPT